MTHEQILNSSAAELEAMTDEQLLKWYEPYLKITRPELAERPVHASRSMGNSIMKEKQAKRDKVNGMLAQLGIDLKV